MSKLRFNLHQFLADPRGMYALEQRFFPHWGSPTESLLVSFRGLYHVR